ncbi:MAG: VOC family protein [Pseudomonadota bacterium]|nr:VOC family protein [Pseudomonadota bacterium]
MSEMNSLHNLAVWIDIPVANLDRASTFYAATLGIALHNAEFDNFKFCVFDHDTGNGGCLVPNAAEVTGIAGILVYLNVDGRIRDAVIQATANGGKVVKPVHPIGQHGFRAVILDSEGNRIALHSTSDA